MTSTITVSIRTLVLAAVAAAAVAVAYLLGAAQSGASATRPAAAVRAAPAASAESPQLVMTGSGEATGVPDQLRFSVSVRSSADDVSAALSQASGTTRHVLATVGAKGVDRADVQTTGLDIRATYDYSGEGPAVLTGYAATENLSVLVRSLPDAGEAISAAADAGGNAIRLSNVRLQIGDEDALLQRARADAMADAMAKAEQYAAASGATLGDVLLVTEGGGGGGRPQVLYDEAAAYRAAGDLARSVPIRAGSADTDVTVSVVWSLE